MADEHGLKRWRDRWTRAGVSTIPLRGKRAICQGWQVRPPPDQWREVGGASFRGNIGVLCGNGLAVSDCDAQRTETHVRAGFDALGLNLPEVLTPSGGKHFYVKVSNVPDAFTYRHLSPDIGPGELRVRNCYVVAPPSLLNGSRYCFVVGSPEALASLKAIDWQDLSWLLPPATNVQANQDTASALPLMRTVATLPLPLVKRGMPRLADELLQALSYHAKGTHIRHYATRSEAEQAAITTLVLAGWTLPDIRSEFQRRRPGHYAEHAKPDRYLETSYQNAVTELTNSPTRLEIAKLYNDAQAWPWPGRSGLLDYKVFLALLALCWQWNSWTADASVRDLAQHAACSIHGVSNALKRLTDRGLIRKAGGWKQQAEHNNTKATAYQVTAKSDRPGTQDTYSTCLSPATMRALWQGHGADELGAAVVERVGTKSITELWRARQAGGLGRSAGVVYGWLSENPLEVVDLQRLTGKGKSTVKRALQGWTRKDGSVAKGLDVYGLAELVTAGWIRGPADLTEVARELDAEGAALRRRVAHDEDRRGWRDLVQRQRTGDVPERQQAMDLDKRETSRMLAKVEAARLSERVMQRVGSE